MEKNRIERKTAITAGDAIRFFFKSSGLAASHNTHLIFKAWEDASGAATYTTRKYFRDGKLYITVSSSVVRSQLSFQKDAIVEKINAILNGDPLFIEDDPHVQYVNELILK